MPDERRIGSDKLGDWYMADGVNRIQVAVFHRDYSVSLGVMH
jgi:hypothetical protein